MRKLFICIKCKTENVSQSAWVNINTEKLVDFVDESTYWCDTCDEETEIESKEDKSLDWREAADYHDGLDDIPWTFTNNSELEQNKNNIIFKSRNIKRILKEAHEVNDELRRKNG
jgi:hypothetical protein